MPLRIMLRPLAATVLLLFAGLGTARAEDPPKELGWKTTAELSYVLTGGNAQSSSLGFKGDSTRTWSNAKLGFHALAINAKVTDFERYAVGTEADYVLVEDETTRTSAERYQLLFDYQRDFSPKFFWMVSAGWEKNEPTGIENRYFAAAGVGNQWINTDTLKWKTNYQLSATREDLVIGGDSNSFTGLRLGSDLLWKFSPNAEYQNVTIVDENLDNTSDWRIEFMNSVSVVMSKRLALKAALTVYYDNEPAELLVPLNDPAGTPSVPFLLDELDTLFTTSLVFNF
jgi:putative salt-induced outer membrane protein YdiY